MTADRAAWDTDAHRERYRKVMYREMTAEHAMREAEADFAERRDEHPNGGHDHADQRAGR